ncbi:calcium/calmodulin-dependent protein kinase type 1B [Colletotrichum karsti]|uniref:non-specific serine/threonine protein kinase n=1 Tax=Colletotrichum karsti TaxID=1095194 RepID=A0A9P6I8I8_9PEZI|nr:calcium/calmodulin-dependent protein kinase type 1B [Colletotrichum karsti]KAF9878328.1 calcium/calmodulin-dependent protein kinase type 1B [Colletotrichum karsti]
MDATFTDDTVQLVKRTELPVRIGPDETVIHASADGGPVKEEHWKSESYLGSGGVGLVFREKCIVGPSFGQLRAVKEIPRPRNRNDDDVDIVNELKGLLVFSQPEYEAYFVRTLGWYQIPSKVFVAMEFLPQGNLHAHLMNQGPIPENHGKLIIRQVLRGLAYIHQFGLAHRGLKPSNLLIRTQPPGGEWWVKIADFGISKRPKRTISMSIAVGDTIGFMAPEVIGLSSTTDDLSPDIAAQKADMWAAGETLHFILTCAHSFGEGLEALREYARDARSFPNERLQGLGLPTSCVTFIQDLMCSHPKLRPDAEQALDHVWARMPNHYATSFSRVACTIRCRGLEAPSVVFSHTGERLLVVSPEKLYLIESANGNVIKSYESSERTFASAAISPDDKFFMVLEDSGRLSRFDAKKLKLLEQRGPFGKMPAGDCFVTYSHDGRCVATAHTGNFVIWKLKGAALPTAGTWRTGNFTVRSMQFTSDDKNIVLALDRAVHIMPLTPGINGAGYRREEEMINYPVIGPVSAVATNGLDYMHCDVNHIYLWRDGAQCWRRQYYHSVPFQDAVYSPSGATVATTDVRGGATLWRVRSMGEVGCLKFPEEGVARVAVSPPMGKYIAMGLMDQKGPRVVVREILSYVP